MARPPAAAANHIFITYINRLRSTISARAPAGSVKRKKGNDATVDIKERSNGEFVSMFIVHVAAVSCAATQVPEIKLANHSLRKTGFCNAVQVELFFIGVFLVQVSNKSF